MPSLKPLHWQMGFCLLVIFSSIVCMISGVTPIPAGIFWIIGFGGLLVFFGKRRQGIIAQREQHRHALFLHWLNKPIPELGPPTPWKDIERAMEALIEAGVEPTYERASDWLRGPCRHANFERIYDMRGMRWICPDCGVSGFYEASMDGSLKRTRRAKGYRFP